MVLFSRLHIPDSSNKKFHILNNWNSVINYCNLTMGFQKVEHFKILYLNSKNNTFNNIILNIYDLNRKIIFNKNFIINTTEVMNFII